MRVGPIATVVLAIVSLAILVPNHPAGRDPAEDTGVFMYAAQRLLEGGAPYRDIWDHKPPGVYFVDAIGLLLAGRSGVWLVQVAFLALAAVLSFRAMRREFGDVAALFGSLAWLFALPRLFLELGQTSFVELFALPLQFGALLLCTPPLAARRAIGIGALGGAALLLKPTLIGIPVAIAVVLLVTRRRAALPSIAGILIGGLVPLVAVLAWALLRGVLADMVDQALVYNRAYAAFAPASDRLNAILEGLRLTLPSGLAPIAIAAWLYALATRRWTSPLVAVALVALPLELALATWGRGYHYYFIAWLPSLGVLAAFAASELRRLAPRRVARIVLVTATFWMCLVPSVLVARLALRTDEGKFRSAAAYVSANTRPEDTVLIWGSHTEVLVLADRRSPTRYVYQYAALSTRGYATPARVEELRADLERARPALILDASVDSFVTPPIDAIALRTWTSPEPQYAPLPELERVIAFIEANYQRAGKEPATGWTVWRLKAP